MGTSIGRFTVQGYLGSGRWGDVLLVEARDQGTTHALKVLPTDQPDMRWRFLQEGVVQAELNHPNIVDVDEMFAFEDVLVLVMELVEGPDLSEVLARRRLSSDEVDVLAEGIFAGVAAIHRAGIVHRDLKPANILLAPRDATVVPKITDFGLLKPLGDLPRIQQTGSNAKLGTPAYMSPEQIHSSGEVGERSDIYALGAILYEMVSGQPAFVQAETMDTFRAIRAGDYVPIAERCPDLPPRRQRAIGAALDPDPGQRPASVDALAQMWFGPKPPAVRQSWIVGGIGLLIVLVSMFVGFGLVVVGIAWTAHGG